MPTIDTLRLDKWLWAARFFKTRKLATQAITGGKIHLNGQRIKPSKNIKIQDQLVIHKESYSWDIIILALNSQRRPAIEAMLLYQETDISQQQRAQAILQRREERQFSHIEPSERPTKKQRRQIHQFKQC